MCFLLDIIHLEADERADSCILDIVENGEVFADAAIGEESTGSQDDSRLSRRPIWMQSKLMKFLDSPDLGATLSTARNSKSLANFEQCEFRHEKSL